MRSEEQQRRNVNRGGRLTALVIFLPPALMLFTFFVALPIIQSGYYSGFRWNGFGTPTNFVGLANYERALSHGVFETAAWNTLLIILVSIFVQLPLALLMALFLENRGLSSAVIRMIFFVPFILAEVVAGLIWRFVYDGEFGIVSAIWGVFGAEAPYVLAERSMAMYAILVVIVWKFFGFHMMIYIAGLQNISREVIEAARMDGATPIQTALFIKIPQLWPSIRISVFFAVLGALQLFDLIIPMTGGGPINSTHTIVTYLYTFGITQMRVGFGSAVGVMLFVVCVAFAFSYRRFSGREQQQ
jgi:raffinose/stachyose/melibiose transport system permease protein